MSRNTNTRFSASPSVDIQRSKMHTDPEVKSSFNIGRLYPLGNPWEVLPGDTWQVDMSAAVRMQPLVSSPMDNIIMDVYFFFEPARLTWEHFREFLGENTSGAWYPQTEYNQPLMTFRRFAHSKSIADYMGLPVFDSSRNDIVSSNLSYSVSRLKFNGYVDIWNNWFRDENLQDPCYMNLSDSDISSIINGDAANDSSNLTNYKQFAYTGQTYCLPVAKTHDLFTSALPQPQKGPEIDLFNQARVYWANGVGVTEADDFLEKYGAVNGTLFAEDNGSNVSVETAYLTNENNEAISTSGQPMNWFVDAGFSVNELRTAFAMQRILEKESLYGSRYTELIRGHFGITPADATIDRPQYLGGFRRNISTNQILQTSETGETPQGNVAGYSLTGIAHDGKWIKSFDQHGYIYPLICFRIQSHTYQQGIDKSWLRRSKWDMYWPSFANLGNSPITNTEIYTTGFSNNGGAAKDDFINGVDHEVFAYQEAWYDYRYIKNIVTGEMRSNVNNSLDSWHYADDYSALPSLSDEWIRETPENVDRALAVQSSVSDQLFGDFKFHIDFTRPMPVYSIPGLIDHN